MIRPHGAAELKPRYVYDDAARAELAAAADTLPSMRLNSAAAATALMLGAGYFTPLNGYMNLADALSVADNLRTGDGLFWPVPILNLTRDERGEAGRFGEDPKSDAEVSQESTHGCAP